MLNLSSCLRLCFYCGAQHNKGVIELLLRVQLHSRVPGPVWRMRLQRACLWLLSCTALVVLVVSEVAQVSGASDLDDNDMINRVLQEKVLSRKRRYLTFPEGSSLQVGNKSKGFRCVCSISSSESPSRLPFPLQSLTRQSLSLACHCSTPSV